MKSGLGLQPLNVQKHIKKQKKNDLPRGRAISPRFTNK